MRKPASDRPACTGGEEGRGDDQGILGRGRMAISQNSRQPARQGGADCHCHCPLSLPTRRRHNRVLTMLPRKKQQHGASLLRGYIAWVSKAAGQLGDRLHIPSRAYHKGASSCAKICTTSLPILTRGATYVVGRGLCGGMFSVLSRVLRRNGCMYVRIVVVQFTHDPIAASGNPSSKDNRKLPQAHDDRSAPRQSRSRILFPSFFFHLQKSGDMIRTTINQTHGCFTNNPSSSS